MTSSETAYGVGIYDQHGKLRFVQISGDEKVLDTLIEGVKARLAEQRLGGIEPAGRG